jgi:hypothetical protein
MTPVSVRQWARAAWLAISTAITGCSEDTIVLATVPDAGPRARCSADAECPAGTYCDKQGCFDPAGFCVGLPASCEDDEQPVCGCNHVTYFNDCLRRAAGIAASTNGECQRGGTMCGGGPYGSACFSGAVCAHLSPAACDPGAPGVCWVLPAAHPTTSSPQRWDACDHTARCVSTFDAIRSGAPYLPSAMGCN